MKASSVRELAQRSTRSRPSRRNRGATAVARSAHNSGWMTRSLEQEAERAREIASAIDGWLSDAQGRALFEAAASTTGRGHIVEIGSWKGRSTTWLALGARLAGRRVYAIDPHHHSHEDPEAATLAEFQDNLRRAGVADVVDPIVMRSEEAAAHIERPSRAALHRRRSLRRRRAARRGTVASTSRPRRHGDVP